MRRFLLLLLVPLFPVLTQAAGDVQTAEPGVDGASAPEEVKFWKYPGSSALKYTQSFYSDNWYKGGFNNQSLLLQLTQDANYAKEKFSFDNRLEAKLGYYTERDENSETQFKTNEDLLRLTSKLGLQAAKAWYYSLQLQGYTQFMNVFDDNKVLKSKFFAPAYATIQLGMDFKPKFENEKNSLSLLLAPVTYNCRYSSDYAIAPNFGIEPGRRFKQAIGSSLEANWKWNIWKELTWTGKAQFFTDYSNNEANIENTLDYAFSKYFGIQLFFHWRFDDSVESDPKLGYHQLKEFLTLNFTVSW